MKTATLCFLLDNNEICLAMKKRGFGVGNYNGFGGKVGDKEEFKNESIEESLIREGKEEFGITVKKFEKKAKLTFLFPDNPSWDQIVHVFICTTWVGRPNESEEMKPYWFKVDEIPYEKMWDDDKYWLPKILNNKLLEAEFAFDTKGKVIKHKIEILRQKW